ncbi:MAG: transcriptional regulator NrdR [Planctomycetota bacterium]
MRCPACNQDKNSVIDSRLTECGAAIRRRRRCLICDRRFTTKERLDEGVRITVIKTDEERVPYNGDKILAGVARACYKLEVTDDQMQQLVDRVEEELFRNHDREVTTEQIGRYVSQRLRRLSAVAYIRFMSVHRKFSTVHEFIDVITDVQTQTAQDSPNQQPLFESWEGSVNPLPQVQEE